MPWYATVKVARNSSFPPYNALTDTVEIGPFIGWDEERLHFYRSYLAYFLCQYGATLISFQPEWRDDIVEP